MSWEQLWEDPTKGGLGRGNSKGQGPAVGKNLCEDGAGRPQRLEQVSSGERGGDEPQAR